MIILIHEELIIIPVVSELIEVSLLLHAKRELLVDGGVDRTLTKKLLIDVACVFSALDLGFEGSLHLQFAQGVPVQACEKQVFLNILSICLGTPQSLQGIGMQQFPQEVVQGGRGLACLDWLVIYFSSCYSIK